MTTEENGITVSEADLNDLEEILALQRLAYQSEAALVNDFSIPPLLETLEDVERQYAAGVVILKAVDRTGAIVGSVRGRSESDTLHIGKLIVHPDCQGRGLGRRLLSEIAARCPHPRQELFTSSVSERNLRLYGKAGFVRFREETNPIGMTLVYLEKLS